MNVDAADAMYKLQILASLAFGQRLPVETIARGGIRRITLAEELAAKQSGRRIRLVAQAERSEDGAIRARVAPEWLDPADPLYNVGGVDNALCVSGDLVGQVLLAGPGAGSLPTASAVIEDVVKLAWTLPRRGRTGRRRWRQARYRGRRETSAHQCGGTPNHCRMGRGIWFGHPRLRRV